MAEPLIRMEHIAKFYGRVQAIEDVTLDVYENEIVGLLGDNGAGQVDADQNPVRRRAGDQRRHFHPRQEGRHPQHDGCHRTWHRDDLSRFRAGHALSIARNLFLGREPIKGPRFLNRMDKDAMETVARDLLRQVGIEKNIPPSTPIGSLSGGERQAVAIARAMHFDSDLIILDEPTNNLGVAETQGVLRFVRNARNSGHSCIFIAHNIHHVFQVVDRIVVMRRGKVVADDIDPKQTSVERWSGLSPACRRARFARRCGSALAGARSHVTS
jgi:simple sugar transport system ATP-binding protein